MRGYESLKQDIEKAITMRLVDDPVSDVFSDKRFIAGLIEKITEKWSPKIVTEAWKFICLRNSLNEIENYLKSKTRKILAGNINLHPVKSMAKGFEIHPSSGGLQDKCDRE